MPHVFTPGFVPPWPPTEAAPAPKQFTLVIPRRPGRVLLGLKLRGFGTGFWNGFGGKVEAGETVEVAAKRELLEEAGIRALDLARMGTLHFHWQEQAQAWEVAVFTCTQWVRCPCHFGGNSAEGGSRPRRRGLKASRTR